VVVDACRSPIDVLLLSVAVDLDFMFSLLSISNRNVGGKICRAGGKKKKKKKKERETARG
jgi:hypothetical protein